MIDYSKVLELIRKSGYTELELCEIAGVSNTIIQRIREGKNVTVNSLHKIYKALGCKASEFIIFTDEKKEDKR